MGQLDIMEGMSKKALFDGGCFEFNNTTIDKKLEVLKSINSAGLLNKVIKEYQDYYKGKEYMIDSLQSSLKLFISNLKYGENHNIWELKDNSIPELVSILKNNLNLRNKEN